ncbi:glycosyltransferase family 2 protein [Congregibacter litoralis]|uniref:Glycosyltransferase involved in cell wall biogenesis n=1 Tax=Congregibacter litoralis KT71 TaxID=314285 RepID=A4A9Z5_9GAMM|nr:glycosyltransferase family 2 protein [Congregibacter litoralis]EAQ97312.1 Glycosyltransferase involved in cell wall biogenesis [Congregibacter litoralis KT71]
MRLSLCMIVKDEAFFIEECLAAAAPHVDEIVVVDTGSTDGTRDIAARYADTLLDFEWIENFSAARNAGLAAATGDWILVLDADERIAAEDYPRLREAMATTAFDGFYLTTRNYTSNTTRSDFILATPDDSMSRGYAGYALHPIMKLFRARDDIRYEGGVHEIVDGSIVDSRRGTLDAIIHHYGEANPERPKKDRALRYLSMMENEPYFKEDGRLLSMAGSAAMYFAEDYAKANRYLRRAAELGYEPSRSLEGAAEAAYRHGNYGEAQDLYRRLYDDGQRTTSLCLNLANLAVRSGDKPRAASLLEECLALGGMGPQTDETIRRNIEFLKN